VYISLILFTWVLRIVHYQCVTSLCHSHAWPLHCLIIVRHAESHNNGGYCLAGGNHLSSRAF